MSRWTSNTSPEQKAAAIEALCDREISAPRVSKMAAAGELAGLPAFDISPSSCRRLRTAENRKREEARKLSPENREAFLESLDSRILTMLERIVDQIEAGEKPGYNLTALRAVQRCLNEHRTGVRAGRVMEAARKIKPAPGQERPENTGGGGSGLVARLRQASDYNAGATPGDNAASSARIFAVPTQLPPDAA